jgi:prophage maintenance system killer protein
MAKKDIVIYKNEENDIELEVNLKDETVWLDQKSISSLFDVKVPAISKHVNNILEEGELKQDATVSKMERVQKEGDREVKRVVDMYNLDMIISIGYRVNSQLATQFRIWATNVLRKYITEGYAINQKRLEQDSKKFELLKTQIKNLEGVIDTYELTEPQTKALIKIITNYTEALSLLDKVDRRNIPLPQSTKTKDIIDLNYKDLVKDIDKLREELELGELFGQDTKNGLESILKSINQTFDKKDVYPSVESKAANLLYLIIKNHPFTDGNKKIGSFTFIRYLDLNNVLYKEDGSKRIEQNTLVALALLIAQSNTKDKDLMIDLVSYLIRMN